MSAYRPCVVPNMVLRRPCASGVLALSIAILGLPGFSGGMAKARASNAIAVSFTDVSVEAGLFDPSWPDTATGNAIDPPGVQVVDINGDGWSDIFVPLEVGGVPDRLFINNTDGTFTESAAAWGIADTNETRSALFFDYDNDGFLDLVLANKQGTDYVLRLFHRRPAEPFFDDVTTGSGMDFILPGPGRATGMAAGDLDDDGFLDLVVGSWTGGFGGLLGTSVCLRNQADGTFVEAAVALGMTTGDSNTWQSLFADLDLDGRIDLWMCEDSLVATRLYRNLAPWSMIDVRVQAGITVATDMGVAVSDFDHDGDFDVYVTDLGFSCAYGQLGEFQPNRFYRNNLVPGGTLSFTDIRVQTGTGASGIGWGCTFIDYDNDTWEDLAVASSSCFQRLFRNLSDGTFDPVGPSVGFDAFVVGGGVVALDYDRDGDRDLLLTARNVPPMLYRNDGGNANHWLVVDPVSEIGNRQAIGAQVRVTVGGVTLLRQISAGCSFKSQEPDEAHFGLDTATLVQSVHITWPDNSWQEHFGVAADQIVSYTRVQGDFDWDGSVGVGADLATFVSVLLGQTTSSNELLRADMNFDGTVDSTDIQPFVSAVLAGP